jgi:amidase
VRERDPDYGLDAIPAVLVRYLRGAHEDAGRMAHPERLEGRTRTFARLGGLLPQALVDRTLAGEAKLAARVNEVLAENDVLLTPAVASPPPAIGRLQSRGAVWTLNTVAGWVPYNGIWNVTGQPAVSVPAGLSSAGLPSAVQIVGRPGGETELLSLSAQIESERPWVQLRPPGFA